MVVVLINHVMEHNIIVLDTLSFRVSAHGQTAHKRQGHQPGHPQAQGPQMPEIQPDFQLITTG